MFDKLTHNINENSVFFQGHKDQFFSKNGMSFKIRLNYGELIDENSKYNKYKTTFLNEINKKIDKRNQGGGKLDKVFPDNFNVCKIKLVDNAEDETCGYFDLYPATAICKKNNCNTFYEIGKGKNCEHDEDSPSEQLHFLALCDDCGRELPIHYMTNIGNSCKSCGANRSLYGLEWERKDEITTYKVKCIHCGNKESLFFLKCDHDKGKRSENNKKKFRGVPARSGSIVHPYVFNIPHFSENESNLNSNKFLEFFSSHLNESLLELPEIIESIDDSFWKLEEVKNIMDRYIENIDNAKYKEKKKVVFKVIKSAYMFQDSDKSKEELEKSFGIQYIREVMERAQSEVDYDKHDEQGRKLNQIKDISSKEYFFEVPDSMSEDRWEDFLNENYLDKINLFQNMSIIQALLGTITGSARKEHPLFRPIERGKEGKPTAYVRDFDTEGIFLRLDPNKVYEWLNKNNICSLEKDEFDTIDIRKIISKNKEVRKQVYILLHTISHMMIQQSVLTTGLAIRSLSEEIFPVSLGIFIYSTNNINIGGLESTFNNDIENWFENSIKLAEKCPQDPACMIHEKGSCNACSYLPEFVCSNFNKDIDRSAIIGGDRYEEGYFRL